MCSIQLKMFLLKHFELNACTNIFIGHPHIVFSLCHCCMRHVQPVGRFRALVLRPVVTCIIFHLSCEPDCIIWTWLYLVREPCPVVMVSCSGWVLAAVPDARDKGNSRDFQSPLCQRHVTDNEHLYMLRALVCKGLFVFHTLLRSCTKLASRVWTCASPTFRNKRLILTSAFTSTTRKHPTSSFPPLGQDFGIQQHKVADILQIVYNCLIPGYFCLNGLMSNIQGV
jgi:hypothetical protein